MGFAVNYPAFLLFSKEASDTIAYASLLALFVYLLFKDAGSGQSLGKRWLRIRVVEVRNGEHCSAPRSLLRNLFLGFGLIDVAFLLGEKSRRLGDHVAGTHVVKA